MNSRFYQRKLEEMAGLIEKMDKYSRPRESYDPSIKLMREVAKHLDDLQRKINDLESRLREWNKD